MKFYVFISIIILLTCFSCRSKSSVIDSSVRVESDVFQEQKTTKETQKDTRYNESSSSNINTQIDEYTRTTKYNPDGSVSEVQEQRRTTGRNELADSSRSGSDVSRIDSTSTGDTRSMMTIDKTIHQLSKADSRAIQGVEWFYVVIVTAMMVLIVWFIKKKKWL